MQVRSTDAGVVVSTPAKLNLFFEVLAKRPDGFHEIETLMVPVGVYDTLEFRDVAPTATQVAKPLEFSCAWAAGLSVQSSQPVTTGVFYRSSTEKYSTFDPQGLPQGSDNIAVRAIELLRVRSKTDRCAVVRLTKRIPSAAGMGGGSSDAAAALVAANLGWGLRWSNEQLGWLAAELGSDVPFFLQSGPAVCRGRGERIEPVVGLGRLHAVVVRPPAGLSTAAVFGVCKPSVSPRSAADLVDALRRGDLRRLPDLMHNALESAARSLSPWIERLEHEFAELDCLATQMSGSGTSYFGICRSARHAQVVASRLRSRRVGWVVATSCN